MATKRAAARAEDLHVVLNQAVLALDDRIQAEKAARMELLRQYNTIVSAQFPASVAQELSSNVPSVSAGHALDKDDPILQWAALHQAVRVRESDE